MKRKSDQPGSLTKRVIDRVAGRISKSKSKEPRRLNTENLESRIFLSGTPMDFHDAPAGDSPSSPAQEAPPLPSQFPVTFGETYRPQGAEHLEEPTYRISLSTAEFSAFLSLAGKAIPTIDSPVSVIGLETAVPLNPFAQSFPSSESDQNDFGWSLSVDSPAPISRIWGDDIDLYRDSHSDPDSGADSLSAATVDSPAILDNELYFDHSILTAADSTNSDFEFDSAGTVIVKALSASGIVASLADSQLRRIPSGFGNQFSIRPFEKLAAFDQHQSGEITLTLPAPASDIGDVSVSGIGSALEIGTSGFIETLDSTVSTLHWDASDASAPETNIDPIEIGRYDSAEDASGTDRLFIDKPESFDFTSLPTGDYDELIASASPLFFCQSGNFRSQTSAKTAKEREKKKGDLPQNLVPLAGNHSGSKFSGTTFTLEWWLDGFSTESCQSLFTISGKPGAATAFSAEIEGASLTLRLQLDQDGECTFILPDTISKDDFRHHVVFTRREKQIFIFLDGEDVTPSKSQIAGLTVFGDDTAFTPPASVRKNHAAGIAVSNFALYEFALGKNTITTHYNSGFAHGFVAPRKGKKTGKPVSECVYVGDQVEISKSASRLTSKKTAPSSRDTDFETLTFVSTESHSLHGIQKVANEEISTLQQLLDRITESDLLSDSETTDLAVFVSEESRGAGTEIKEVDWEITRSILEHFGIQKPAPPSDRNASHSLFISGDHSENRLHGFIAQTNDSGRISALFPLEFDSNSSSLAVPAELVSALKLSAAAPLDTHSPGRRETSKKQGHHLDKVSSVQSDVFGIRDH